MNRANLRAKVGAAIRRYNKYRSPEVNAKLLSVEDKEDRFVVLFTGSFCRTCGFYDYFEDLIYDLLDESNIKAKITKVKEEWETENFKVTFEVEE